MDRQPGYKEVRLRAGLSDATNMVNARALLIRRLAYVRWTQQNGYKFFDTATKLREEGGLADVRDMTLPQTEAQWEAFIPMKACSEKLLLQKFVEMEPAYLTYTKMLEKAK